MEEPVFYLTPSFIRRLISVSRELKSEKDIMGVFHKLAEPNKSHLSESDIRMSDVDEEEIIFDNISEKLLPLAEDLYALVSIPDN